MVQKLQLSYWESQMDKIEIKNRRWMFYAHIKFKNDMHRLQYKGKQKMNIELQPSTNLEEFTGQGRKTKEALKKSLSLKVKISRKQNISKKSSQIEDCPENREKKQNVTSLEEVFKMKELQSKKSFQDLYKIEAKIGEGCHSSVYYCTEIHTGVAYAVKIVKKTDPQLFPSIMETYKIMSKLNHENVVKSKLLFVDEKIMTCHLVQEVCNYPDLGDYIRKNGKTDSAKAATILEQLLKTVAYMHSKGACHRDIKPENIMYCPEAEKIKLVDFELAKKLKYHEDEFGMLTKTGTLAYRAPETFKTLYKEKIDLWAVGVVAYQLFTGRLPFSASYERKIIQKICNQEPDYTGLPSEEKQLLQKLLCKNPNERISAVEALSSKYFLLHSNDCKKFNSSSVDTPRSPSAGKEIPQRKRRNTIVLNNRFYDDDVTQLFLGSESSCGKICYRDTSADTEAESPY